MTPDLRTAAAQSIERTNAMCSLIPVLAATRAALLAVEAAAHAAGWDGPDAKGRVFLLDNRRGAPEVQCRPADNLTTSLHAIARRTQGNVHHATQHMGQTMREMRAGRARSGEVMRAGFGSTPPPGWAFYGVGLQAESWMTFASAEQVRAGIRPSQQPDRLEVRTVYASTVDGLYWTCIRQHSGQPFACAHTHEDTVTSSGGIAHGLSLMTQAMADSPVPAMPLLLDHPLLRRRS